MREPDEEATEFAAARAELRRALQATGDEAHALMGDLLEYHRREARPVWWWFFARTKMTPEQLVEDSESIGCLEPDGSEPEKVAEVDASTASASPCSSRSSTSGTRSSTP